VADLIRGLTIPQVAANLATVRAEIADAARRVGRDPATVELLGAVKYVATDEMPVLADAGLSLVGENRASDLKAKAAIYGERFTWDFIGQLQSRRVRDIVGHVRLIHSLASDSALRELTRQAPRARRGLRVLVEVNLAAEPDKAGIAPADLDAFLDRCGQTGAVAVAGLMAMPPATARAQDSRRWFAALGELAREHRLEHLSMGTTQDFTVAVEEGATIVRVGRRLYV